MTVLLTSFVVTLVLLPTVRVALVRIGHFDVPNERSSHHDPIPLGAGIALVIGMGLAVCTAGTSVNLNVLLISVLLGAVGLLDDFRDLTATSRLCAQLLLSMAFAFLMDEYEAAPWSASLLLVTLWSAAYVNAFNFMDGINGMSAVQALVSGIAIAAVSESLGNGSTTVLGLALVGAGLAFLPFNAFRAQIFLGDVGSYFIGFWIAASVVLLCREGVPFEVALSPTVPYLVDTAMTLLWRLRRGENLTRPHRSHAYQILVDRGIPQLRVSLGFGLMSTCTAWVAFANASSSPFNRTLAISALVGILIFAMGYTRAKLSGGGA